MSDNYEAVYSATSRAMSGCVDAVERAASHAFDISWQRDRIVESISSAAISISEEMTRPSVVYRPQLFMDGNNWCALYGENIQDGLAAFGSSPAEAMVAFDRAFKGVK